MDHLRDGSSGKDRVVGATAAGAAAVSVLAAHRLSAAEPTKELAGILEKIPAEDHEVVGRLCKKLLAGGPAVIEQLVGLVGEEFGDPDGVKPKYALHGLAIYAARPAAENDRKMVAETLARQFDADLSAELKAFIIRQLQLCGRPEEVPALGVLLGDERLCEPATQALLAIGGDEATVALRAALPKARGGQRATIIKALGRLRDKDSAGAIRRAARDSHQNVRLMALYALGNMGDAGAVAILLRAAEVKRPYERSQATDACLLLGRRLAEAGNTRDAERIFRQVLSKRTAPEDVHDRCAALEGLAGALGAEAAGDVIAALDSDDLKYRHPAARTALDLAKSLNDDQPHEAEKLLKKILEATGEKAVLQQAEMLLG